MKIKGFLSIFFSYERWGLTSQESPVANSLASSMEFLIDFGLSGGLSARISSLEIGTAALKEVTFHDFSKFQNDVQSGSGENE